MNIKLVGAECATMRLPEKPPSEKDTQKLLSEQKNSEIIEEIKPCLTIPAQKACKGIALV